MCLRATARGLGYPRMKRGAQPQEGNESKRRRADQPNPEIDKSTVLTRFSWEPWKGTLLNTIPTDLQELISFHYDRGI